MYIKDIIKYLTKKEEINMVMDIVVYNCEKCPDFKQNKCDGKEVNCMCKKCPRNLGQCLTVRYCRETESVLDCFDY